MLAKQRRLSADGLLASFGMFHPPIDIFGMIKRLNIGLWFEPDLQWSGAVDMANSPGMEEAHIWVKVGPGETPERQRFTAAHELGHLMLHLDGTQAAFRDDTFAGDEKEAQANGYAANLLVPMRLLDIHARSSADTQALARLFQVSPAMMRIRLMKRHGREVAWEGNP